MRGERWWIASWVALLINGLSILVFGLIVVAAPGDPIPFYRSIGVASIGMGLFGIVITWVPYRRREQWAWWSLWYFPLFWAAHFFGSLPPGQDHIHQVALTAASLFGLLVPAREFFPSASAR